MLYRERIIKDLEICTTRPCYCTGCSYIQDCALDSQQLMEDALELLKEKEPVCTEYDRSIVLFSCRDCKTQLLYGQRYCHMCGRKIKWNK